MHTVELQTGSKQGAPQSGMLFVSTVESALGPVHSKWQRLGYGIKLGDKLLSSVSFVDDTILAAATPEQGKEMLSDIELALAHIGLHLNSSKTSYISTLPNRAECLPGSNENKNSIRVMGRRFRFAENTETDKEISDRLHTAGLKLQHFKKVLRAKTQIEHRPKIYRACLIQSILWGSETWVLTQKRCQRLRGFEMRILLLPLRRRNFCELISTGLKNGLDGPGIFLGSLLTDGQKFWPISATSHGGENSNSCLRASDTSDPKGLLPDGKCTLGLENTGSRQGIVEEI